MESFDFEIEREFNPLVHVEKKLGFMIKEMYQTLQEPGQVSPNHCHPDAAKFICYEGGGIMRTENEELKLKKVVLLFIRRVSFTNSLRVKDNIIPSSLWQFNDFTYKDWPTNPTCKQQIGSRIFFC